MPNDRKHHIDWLGAPEEHDYAAAVDYLSLLLPLAQAEAAATAFRGAAVVCRKAKDLLRATGLPLLAPANPHVAADLAKIEHGRSLSPVLVVRGDLPTGRPAAIADGYHRICASYHTDENAEVALLLIDLPTVADATG